MYVDLPDCDDILLNETDTSLPVVPYVLQLSAETVVMMFPN
jgi:hypothetical protein